MLLFYQKMEATGFPERFLPLYQTAQCYVPEDNPNNKFALH